MGRIESSYYYNGMESIMDNAFKRSEGEIKRQIGILERAEEAYNKTKSVEFLSGKVAADSTLKMIRRQTANFDKISELMAAMKKASDDKEISRLGSEASSIINSLVVNSGSGNPYWKLTSDEISQMRNGIVQLTNSLRTELINKKDEPKGKGAANKKEKEKTQSIFGIRRQPKTKQTTSSVEEFNQRVEKVEEETRKQNQAKKDQKSKNQLGNPEYYYGVVLDLINEVLAKCLIERKGLNIKKEQMEEEYRKTKSVEFLNGKVSVESTLKMLERQSNSLINIVNLMDKMKASHNDSEIGELNNSLISMMQNVYVDDKNPSWKLTEEQEYTLNTALTNFTSSLRKNLAGETLDSDREFKSPRSSVPDFSFEDPNERKKDSFFGRLFNKKANEEYAQKMVDAMASGKIDVNGQPIHQNEEVLNGRRMGYIKVGILTTITALITIAIIVIGVLLVLHN